MKESSEIAIRSEVSNWVLSWKFERNKKFVYLSCHLANSRQHTFPWILVQYIICWTNLDFYFKFESSPAEWHTEISPHRQAGSTMFFAAQFFFFARMSCSEQSTFHGQAFDRAWSFRSSLLKTSRRKKILWKYKL